MTLFFLHLHECGTVLEDVEGHECKSLEMALKRAVATARDVMIGEIGDGRLCLGCHICVTDDTGRELGRVAFRDAIVITGLIDRPGREDSAGTA